MGPSNAAFDGPSALKNRIDSVPGGFNVFNVFTDEHGSDFQCRTCHISVAP